MRCTSVDALTYRRGVDRGDNPIKSERALMPMNKYVTELIGTFFLVLTIGCTVLLGGSGVIPPIAIGSALMVMIFAGGHISGGHYNPAVTLGVYLRGRCDAKDVVPYWVSQLVGAALAAMTVRYLLDGAPVTA